MEFITAQINKIIKKYIKLRYGIINLTTKPLTACDIFTSQLFKINRYNKIIIVCFTDVNGTIIIEQSIDGKNWDVQKEIPYIENSKPEIIIDVIGIKARVIYKNSNETQSIFRLSTIIKKN